MKTNLRLIVFLFICVFCACSKSQDTQNQQAGCIPANLQNGIIAFYAFNSGSINDSSGNNYNLLNSTSASPGMDRGGNGGCAFHFDAINNEFLTFNNPTFLDDFQTLPFSISLWYRSDNPNANYELLIGRDSGLHCPNTFGQWSVGLYDLQRPVFGINEYSLWGELMTNGWTHLAVTCEGTALKLYVNGVLTNEIAGTGCSSSFPTSNAGDLYIGKDFTGLLDDIIIYDHILTPSEIIQLKDLMPCCE